MDWWMWIAAGLGLLLLEALTPGSFVFVFMALASLMVAALQAAGVLPAFWQQSAAATALAGVNMLLFRRRLLSLFTPAAGAAPIDSMVGAYCTATATMAPQGRGTVEFHGAAWSAVNLNSTALAVGARCRIDGCEGLTLRLLEAAERAQ